MEAKVLEIQDKTKNCELDIARLSDFRYREGAVVDAKVILDHPQTTLYCVDDDHRQAVFVESPPELDLSQRPFYFIEQYKHAQRLLTVSYQTLHELAAVAGVRFQRLIPMQSVGRCGGTLLSRALNRLNTVFSLDEPDFFTNVAMTRPDNGSRDAELTALLRSGTQLMYRPMKPGVDTLLLKFRPFAIKGGDLMYQAFPDAKSIFLYRNAETWARSVGRSIQAVFESQPADAGTDSTLELLRMMDLFRSAPPVAPAAPRAASSGRKSDVNALRRTMPALVPFIRQNVVKQMEGSERRKLLWLVIAQRLPILRSRSQSPTEFLRPFLHKVPPMKVLTVMWVSMLQRYLAFHKKGIPILALQYETLAAEPEAVLRTLFEYWGLAADQVPRALGAFAEDSQKGTLLSRDRVGSATRGGLDPEWLAQMREVLQSYPEVSKPDVVLPNSVTVPRASRTAS
jgi:hypothetical protein